MDMQEIPDTIMAKFGRACYLRQMAAALETEFHRAVDAHIKQKAQKSKETKCVEKQSESQ